MLRTCIIAPSRRLFWEKSQKRSLAFNLFLLGFICYFIDIFRFALSLRMVLSPKPIVAISVTAGPLLTSLAAIVAIHNGQLRYLKTKYRQWLFVVSIALLLITINGIVFQDNAIRDIYFDLLLFPGVVAAMIMGSNRENFAIVERIVTIVFIIAFLYCILNIRSLGESAQYYALDRSKYAGDDLYYVWTLTGVLMIYFLITFFDRPLFFKLLTGMAFIVYFLMAIIYLKRQPIIQTFLVISLMLFKYIKFEKFRKLIGKLLLVGFILTALLLILNIFKEYPKMDIFIDKLGERIEGKSGIWDTIMDNDRLTYDLSMVFTKFSSFELISGRGLGGIVEDPSSHYPYEGRYVTTYLHNSIAFMILKGGLIFCIIWYIGWIMFMKDYWKSKDIENLRYYIPIIVIILQSVYGSIFQRDFYIFYYYCAGVAMSYVPKKYNKDNSINVR